MKLEKIMHGDCLEELKKLEDNSVDAIVTDPPYGLSFMGKKWDYDVPSEEIWKECLRVLKHGGYLLAFAGTRTQHRMAVRIEDAGFEIRDMIAWVYGSGFPKSLNIGKAVDALQGNEREVVGEIRAGSTAMGQNSGWNEHENKTVMDLTKGHSEWEGWGTALKPSFESITVAQKSIQSSSVIENLFVSLLKQIKTELCQYQSFALIAEQSLRLNQQGLKEDVSIAQWIAENNINIQEDLYVLMDMLRSELEINSSWNIVLLWLNTLVELYEQTNTYTTLTKLNPIIELKILNSMEWENIFQSITLHKDNKTSGLSANVWSAESLFSVLKLKLMHIQELSAQENVMSQESEKDFAPNLDPIIMSRKPLSEKTVALNVLKWGTGGIDIDGSRVESSQEDKEIMDNKAFKNPTTNYSDSPDKIYSAFAEDKATPSNPIGRFPANLIHDGSEEVVDMFPYTKSGAMKKAYEYQNNGNSLGAPSGSTKQIYDSSEGNASRFFYCAKASKSERNAGCDGLLDKERVNYGGFHSEEGLLNNGRNPENRNSNKNNHPTVKPIALMEYLVKLVSREGAIILDPFAGSGSTGVACKNTNRDYILIERENDYIPIINARLKNAKPKTKPLTLF
jgi:DNA modification methylase